MDYCDKNGNSRKKEKYMIVQKLHNNWKMRKTSDKTFFPAKVPGSVYNDLLINKEMEDPFWRDNEEKAWAIMQNDFEYTGVFTPDERLFRCGRIALRCKGLDTLADIYLNEKPVAKTDNMHRSYEFDVGKLLRKGENTLRIVFSSPIQFMHRADVKLKLDGSSDCTRGFPHLRKAHCMSGWDWGPRLPDAGIWRDIELLGITRARIDNVHITQKHKKGRVDLVCKVRIDQAASGSDSPGWEISITAPGGETEIFKNSPETISIQNPLLWWPNGYGGQNLYTIKVTLSHNEQDIDSWERRIGLRTMTVHIQKDKWGESFAQEVNGVQMFAMGADYIPEDSIFSRITAERTRTLLEQCVAANFNSIRVWGGGYYLDDFFYDICDELGLVIWHDFMFACAVYDLNHEFEENIRAELADNIKRIRHHASLGLWCGNNEMEMFVKAGQWVSRPKEKADYIKMYEYIFPQIAAEHDEQTFYWPSSPSSGGSFDEPNDPSRGDVHYWEVWHGNKPFADYRNYYYRYLSEFGFQSFPCLKTIESFTLPGDRNIFSWVMEKHQRNNAANGKIMNYLSQTFLYPTDFDTLLYASQLLQAEAIKYGVEHFRRNRNRCMGAVYWQLNDIWPVASWASIDYFGRWKALHYYARRFFQPLAISCLEEGLLTQDQNINAEPYTLKKSIRLCVENETFEKKNLAVRWEIRDLNAKVLRQEQITVSADRFSSRWLPKVDLPELAINDQYISFHLFEGTDMVSEGTVILSLPKFFHWPDPQLQYAVNGDTITIKAVAYAKSVEIQNGDQNLILSDNYFDMDGGEKTVRIISGKPKGIKLRSVFDIK
jgi:beta-mannosidase